MNYDVSGVSLDYITHLAVKPDLSMQQTQQLKQSEPNINMQQPERAQKLEGDVKIPVACDYIKQKLDEMNEKLIGANKRVEYTFNERPRACVITIIDTRTNEVIKELPPKEILDMVADIWDRFGILVDEKR